MDQRISKEPSACCDVRAGGFNGQSPGTRSQSAVKVVMTCRFALGAVENIGDVTASHSAR